MAELSVIVHTKNSAETLSACLSSVKNIADELIIMDMGSTDNTLKIARQFKAQILDHPDVGYADPARNKALQAANKDWILVVDSDEEIPPTLAEKIKELINQESDTVAYAFPRRNLIFNKWAQSGWWPDYQRRLFKRGHVNWPPELHGLPQVDGHLTKLAADEKLAIIHHNYQTIDDFIDRAQRYSTIAAKEMKSGNRKSQPSLISAWLEEFTRRWFVDKAYEQNHYGQTLAWLQSSFEALALAKYWESLEFKQSTKLPKLSAQLANAARSAKYWEADLACQNAVGLSKIYWRLRRRFKL